MKIRKYGITLIRLREEHLELVRKWRNHPDIADKMEYQSYITVEMQRTWFESINNIHNSYYIIEYQNNKIGLINEKNIDYENKSAEAGLFIWDKNYHNSHIPLLASLCLLEIGFNIAGGEKSFIKVQRNNKKAVEYNKSFGFKIYKKNDETGFDLYVLDKEAFQKKIKKIAKILIKLTGGSTEGCVVIEPHDYTKGIGHFTREIMSKSGIKFRKEIEGEDEVYYYNWEF